MGIRDYLPKTQYIIVGNKVQTNNINTQKSVITTTSEYNYLRVTLTQDGIDEEDYLHYLE